MFTKIFEQIYKVYSTQGARGVLSRSYQKLLEMTSDLMPPESLNQLARDAGSYWSSSKQNEFLRDQSHWLGHGRFANIETWKKIGVTSKGMVEQLCFLANRQEPIIRMIEWGPGGGSNAVSFAPNIKTFFGVDISEPNLMECGKQLEKIGFQDFRPVLINPSQPEAVLAEITVPCDLFLSTAVYQHFPSKEYGRTVTKTAANLLAPNGIALIQIRYDNASKKYSPKNRNYKSNAKFFTSYTIDEFWQIASSVGFIPLSVLLNPSVNYAYFFLKRAEST